MSEAAELVAAIDENRRHVGEARMMVRQSTHQPALWIDVGQRAVRTYSLMRIGSVAVASLFRLVRMKFLFRTTFRTLPLAAAGWGAYRLMRR